MASAGRTVNGFVGGFRTVSKRLIFSYIIDWIIILGTAAVGTLFHYLEGNRRPFDLRDRTISYPWHPNTVSSNLLIVISFIAPGAIIFFVCLFLVPGPTVPKDTPAASIWRRKIWEINTGWMGLGVSLAGTFMVTEGMKKLYGKPRPDLIDRCQPDLDNLARYIVGGLSTRINPAPLIVDPSICQQTDAERLRDGFASFPSGHSSFVFAGLLYLTFFLASKFSIFVPYLQSTSTEDNYYASHFTDYHRSQRVPSHNDEVDNLSSIPLRNRAAAPPLPALLLVFAPLGTCLFVTASRFYDNRHHGFDILSGSILGIFFAWFGFRLYHLPIRQGSGWSWGARSRDRGFWTGVGTGGWVGHEGWSRRPDSADIENGGFRSGRDKMELAQQQQQLRGVNVNGPPAASSYEMRHVPGSRGRHTHEQERFSGGNASEWQAV